jgi:TonB family protein
MRERFQEAADAVSRTARAGQRDAHGELTMVSIADLRKPEFSLDWHEAVAVIAELATVVVSQGLSRVPAPESVVLTPDGRLHVLDEGPQDLAPVRWLADLLEVLLSPMSCPPELRQLIADGVADPPAFASVQAFVDALAFFERPGRREVLQGIAARGSEFAIEEQTQVEMERLQARARDLADQEEATQVKKAEKRKLSLTLPPHLRRFALVTGGSLIAIGVIGGGVAALLSGSPARAAVTENLRTRVGQLTHGVAKLTDKGLAAIGVRTTGAPPPPSTPVEVSSSATRKTTPRRPPRALAATISIKELQHWTYPVPTTPSPIAPEVRERAAVVADNTIYSADAIDVEPAVLVRPQLPSDPPPTAPREQIGILEIIVSATGEVERVRLVSPSNRFHDRMIVSAAKAWSFEPATKDGRRVRYRTQIRVTL